MRQLCPGIDVDQGPGQHANLTDPIEGGGPQWCQPHDEVDQKKRKYWHQSERKQVEGAVSGNAHVEGFEFIAKATLYGVAQDIARNQEG